MGKNKKQISLQKRDDLDAAHKHKHQLPMSCDAQRRFLQAHGVEVDYITHLLRLPEQERVALYEKLTSNYVGADMHYMNHLLRLPAKQKKVESDEKLTSNYDTANVDYMNHLLRLSAKQKKVESDEKLTSNDEELNHNFSDDDDEEEEIDDPDVLFMLENLKEHGKSHIIEYEENGLRTVIKFEGASSSDTESDEEPRETLRKQKDASSNQMPRAETQEILDSHPTPSREIRMLTCRQTRSKSKSEREESAKSSAHSSYRRSTLSQKGDSSLGKNCGQQYRRKLRSATKQSDEHFNRGNDVCRGDSQPTPTKEMEKVTRTNPRGKSKTQKEEDIVEPDPVSRASSQNRKRSRIKHESEYDEDIIQLDPDYHLFTQNLKLVEGHYALMAEGIEIVYDQKSVKHIRVKEDHDDDCDDNDDESDSHVEIIDSTEFYKMNEGSNSNHRDTTGESEFRHKVIAALRKPYDAEEYQTLLHDIQLHKPKERHIDLRSGRERPIGTQEDGKSYLDYYPVLREKLLQAQGNLPKRLNLLRGFFLWIKQPEAFFPWQDDECLAVRPRSR